MNVLVLAVLWSAPVDFDTEIVPLLTRRGCNAAACHGSAAGRGGFRLSLFGGDPAADHDAIVHQLEGRRVDLVEPEASLLVRKPTLQLEHGGGLRFSDDSDDARLLSDWISTGAPRHASPDNPRRLVGVELASTRIFVERVPAEFRVDVVATFSDGTRRDVTRWATFEPDDPAAIEIVDQGQGRLLERGQHRLTVRFLTHLRSVELLAPLGEFVGLREPSSNPLDSEIDALLQRLRLPASPRGDDTAILRRVTLDLAGRLPTPEEIHRYTSDTDSGKLARLVDQLMASDAFNDYWTFRFAQLLRIGARGGDAEGARAFHAWLRDAIATNRPLDRWVTELLMAQGDSHVYGPANFHRVAEGPRERAEYVAELLMGVRLRCANCHNHPLDHWTQDDYHGLAAVLARIDPGRVVRLRPRGDVIHPATGEPARPRLPGRGDLDPGVDGRLALAQWLIAADNPYFARAQVNRVWKALMGRGLVEPTDDLRVTNPPTHARLLDWLAQDFVSHGFDLRHVIRQIVLSEAYARGPAIEGNRADDRFYSRALERPLEPELLLDAISDVTGVAEVMEEATSHHRAIERLDAVAPSAELEILGRCTRRDSCESPPPMGGLTTKLHLINGPLLNARIAHAEGRLARMLSQGVPTPSMVEEFFLRALSRPPSPDELRDWTARLDSEDSAERRALAEDFLWSLLSSRSFTRK